MIIGEKIKKARKSKGLTQSQLAERLQITQSAIVQFEKSNNVKLHTLKKIADALKLSSVSELLGFPDENMFSAYIMSELEGMPAEERKIFLNEQTQEELDDYFYSYPDEKNNEPYSDMLFEGIRNVELLEKLDLTNFWDIFGSYLLDNHINFKATQNNSEMGKIFSIEGDEHEYFLTNSQARQLPEMILEKTHAFIRSFDRLNKIDNDQI